MSIFQKTKTDNAGVKPAGNEEVKLGMSYTELVSQELDNIMNPLKQAKKDIEDGINSLLAANKNGSLTAAIVALRLKEEINKKELVLAPGKYAVDTELLIMAATLDHADGSNKGIELFHAIGLRVNEILPMLPEIKRCYCDSDYFAPMLFIQIREAMQGLVACLNEELPKLRRVDKKALEQKLYDRMEILRASKMESQAVTDKLKNL